MTNEQEKKQREELANISEDALSGVTGGAISDTYDHTGIRCPSCQSADLQCIDVSPSASSYKCNQCNAEFTFNTAEKAYGPRKDLGSCS